MAFFHFLETLVTNIIQKLMDIATKTGIDAAKTTFKRVVQKTGQARGDLIENKIAEKITSVGK